MGALYGDRTFLIRTVCLKGIRVRDRDRWDRGTYSRLSPKPARVHDRVEPPRRRTCEWQRRNEQYGPLSGTGACTIASRNVCRGFWECYINVKPVAAQKKGGKTMGQNQVVQKRAREVHDRHLRHRIDATTCHYSGATGKGSRTAYHPARLNAQTAAEPTKRGSTRCWLETKPVAPLSRGLIEDKHEDTELSIGGRGRDWNKWKTCKKQSTNHNISPTYF